jgi:hypothetical protein
MKPVRVGGVPVTSGEFLTVEELAGRWHKSTSGVRKLLYSGKIPPGAYSQIGERGRLLFRVSEIERLEREST